MSQHLWVRSPGSAQQYSLTVWGFRSWNHDVNQGLGLFLCKTGSCFFKACRGKGLGPGCWHEVKYRAWEWHPITFSMSPGRGSCKGRNPRSWGTLGKEHFKVSLPPLCSHPSSKHEVGGKKDIVTIVTISQGYLASEKWSWSWMHRTTRCSGSPMSRLNTWGHTFTCQRPTRENVSQEILGHNKENK